MILGCRVKGLGCLEFRGSRFLRDGRGNGVLCGLVLVFCS